MKHNLGHDHDLGGRSKPLARRAFHSLHRTMHLHRLLMVRRLAEYNIPPAQAFCVKELGHNDGITQGELARLLHVSRPTVTVMLKNMEKQGLITREVDVADQRFTRIHLTGKGHDVHNTMHGVVDDIIVETISTLPESDQAELERLLDALGESMTAALGESPEQPFHDHGTAAGGAL